MKNYLSFLSLLLLLIACTTTPKEKETEATPVEIRYGLVNLSVCNMHAKNDFSSEMISQALLGMPVKILDEDRWYKTQTPDDYTGWVHTTAIQPLSKAEYDAWNQAEKIVVTSHYGFTYQQPDPDSQTVSDVVAGDRLRWDGTEDTFYKVSYPDGRKAYIPQTIGMPEKAWRASIKQDPESIIKTAYTMMGIPYLWAGISSKGVDCSGYMRAILLMHDIIIPRDASQQAPTGERIEISDDFSNLQPGDFIFFGKKAEDGKKERVVHVGLYVGNKQFIHSQGDVHVSSLDPSAKDFDEFNLNRLLFASRILPYINKQEGLNTTATNPYYN